MALLIALVAMVISNRKDVQSAGIKDQENVHIIHEENETIGGWLILVAISLFLSFFAPLMFFIELSFIFEPDLWIYFTDPASEGYHGMFSYLIYFEVFANLTLVVFLIVIVMLFFKKKSAFPQYFIVYIIVSLFVVLTDVILADMVFGSYPDDWGLTASFEDNIGQMFGAFVYATVWIPYMITSTRVKKTFVH